MQVRLLCARLTWVLVGQKTERRTSESHIFVPRATSFSQRLKNEPSTYYLVRTIRPLPSKRLTEGMTHALTWSSQATDSASTSEPDWMATNLVLQLLALDNATGPQQP